MPCRSDYMNPTDLEIELSRVLMFLEETQTGTPVDTKSSNWQGNMPGVYGADHLKTRTDEATAQLCRFLTYCSYVKELSLELQMWWRDHQIADRAREKAEAEAKAKAQAEAPSPLKWVSCNDSVPSKAGYYPIRTADSKVVQDSGFYSDGKKWRFQKNGEPLSSTTRREFEYIPVG